MDDTEEPSGPQAQASLATQAGFSPLSLSEVEGFPVEGLQKLAEQWSKAGSQIDHARARAVLPKLPMVQSDAVAKATLKVVLRSCSDEQAIQWLEKACADVKAKLNQGYARWREGQPLGSANFMAEAAMAARRSKFGLSKLLAQGSAGLGGTVGVEQAGGVRRQIDFAGESLRRGSFDAFRAGFDRTPMDRSTQWAVCPDSDSGCHLRSSLDLSEIEKAWDSYKPLFQGDAGLAVSQRAFKDLQSDHQLMLALAYSPSRKVRSEFEDCGGGTARDAYLASMDPTKKSSWWNWLGRVCKSGDQGLIESALASLDLTSMVHQREPSERLPLAMFLAKQGGEVAMRSLHGASKGLVAPGGSEDLFSVMAIQSEWVWESQDGRRRKKGDALAYCVALGNQGAAACMLELAPHLAVAYAKDLVKYCAARGNDIQGQATAAWERILLGQISKAKPKPKGKAKIAMAGEVVEKPVVRSRVRL